jgi:hypothetical protein
MPGIPSITNTTLPGGGFIITGAWKRILLQNFDAVETIGFKINSSAQAKLPPLTNVGDTFPQGIERVELINLGGTPEYQLILHV